MKKIAIVGCGAVGGCAAFSIFSNPRIPAAQLLLYDIQPAAAEACCADLQDAAPLLGCKHSARVCAEPAELAGADLLLLCFTAQICDSRPAELAANLAALERLAPALQGFAGVVIAATNPNDAIVFHTRRLLNLPAARVFGTGTSLDSARLRGLLSRELGVDAEQISANMLGEHGDSQIAHFSGACIAQKPIEQAFAERGAAFAPAQIEELVRRRGGEIFARKGKTEYGIAAALNRLAQAVLCNERTEFCVSFVQSDLLSVNKDITLVIAGSGANVGDGCVLGCADDGGCLAYSRPAIIGAGGICAVPALCATSAELAALAHSLAFIKSMC